MPTFRLTRISSPGLLEKISPDRLLQFLEPMREYLEFEEVWPLRDYLGFAEDVKKKYRV